MSADQEPASGGPAPPASAAQRPGWLRVPPRRRQLLAAAALALLALTLWFVPPVWRLLGGPVTVTRYTKTSGETRATVGPGLPGWISTKKISRHALHAVIAAEDGLFYDHHGFDFAAIRRSYATNVKQHKYARGGSTISQQVVKMAFLGREKTLLRKLREASGTVLMELILPKERILEWYINLAEFGDGVYGIQDGCWHYFKTKPELLTIEQAVHLALVLPSPNAWSRGLRLRRLTPFGQRRFTAILNTMRGMGYVTQTQWLTAVTRGDFGRPIKGYAELVAADESHKDLCPGSPGCPPADELDDESEDLGELPAADSPATAASPESGPAPAGAAPLPESAAPQQAVAAPTPAPEPALASPPAAPDAAPGQLPLPAPAPPPPDPAPAPDPADPDASGLPTKLNGGYE